MYFWERKNGIRDSDEKSAGCGILVKKERECGIRTSPSRPCLKPGSAGTALKQGKGIFCQVVETKSEYSKLFTFLWDFCCLRNFGLRFGHQPQTVLLRNTLTRTIILYRLI